MACSNDDVAVKPMPAPDPGDLPAISLTGASFEDGSKLPLEFTCDDEGGKSPNLLWHGIPDGTKSIVVWVNDIDADNFVHWLVFDIPPQEAGLTAGIGEEPILADGAHQGRNSFGHFGWGPPCPPVNGGDHHYVFRVYALNITVGLNPGASEKEVSDAMRLNIIGYGTLTATYARVETN
jgi:Raf kinase inhibitor-like YbhB/YbcL family protein